MGRGSTQPLQTPESRWLISFGSDLHHSLCPELFSLSRLRARTTVYSSTAPTQSKTINRFLTEGLSDCRNSRSLETSGSLHCTTPKNTIQIVVYGCASSNLVKFAKLRLGFLFQLWKTLKKNFFGTKLFSPLSSD